MLNVFVCGIWSAAERLIELLFGVRRTLCKHMHKHTLREKQGESCEIQSRVEADLCRKDIIPYVWRHRMGGRTCLNIMPKELFLVSVCHSMYRKLVSAQRHLVLCWIGSKSDHYVLISATFFVRHYIHDHVNKRVVLVMVSRSQPLTISNTQKNHFSELYRGTYLLVILV